MAQVTLGIIQQGCTADLAQNLRQTETAIREAARRGAQVICLQELYRSLYFAQTEAVENFSLAETVPGPSFKQMAQLAKELGVVLIVPIFEKRMEGVYHNAVLVIDADGAVLGTYRKMHIPDDPGFYEKYYFAPGDLGFPVFKTRYGKIGVLICWDQWYPEAARLLALQGAQILFYPTAIGFSKSDQPVYQRQREAWITIQRAHAIANGVFVAAANRVGVEGQLHFWGSSFVSDPFGALLAQASDTQPDILIQSCDLDLIEKTRQLWPFLRDRRIDAYQPILARVIDA